MNDFHFLLMLTVHFIADFVLQTHKQATLKSTNIIKLGEHVATYSFMWFIVIAFISNIFTATMFALITFAAHFITDYFTSKINKKFFDAGDYHNGFVGVGFDQILHYIQLYYTFKILL